MKKLLFVLPVFLIISSCKKKEDPKIAVDSISLSPSSLTLKADESSPLKAVITPENITNKSIEWSSSDESIAAVSPAGLVTAKSTGTAAITVTTAEGNKTASCTVTVILPVSTIALTPNPAIVAVGDRMQLRPVVTPENASIKTVTWSSSDVSKATVDKDGWVTGVAQGRVTITATAADGSAVKGEATLTVKSSNASVSAITLGAENFGVVFPAEEATTILANAPRAISSNLAAVPVNITAVAGSTIKIGTAAFTQGQVVNFTNPVTFTVTTEDGTTIKTYTVGITAYDATTNPYGIYTVKDLIDVKNGLSASFLLKNVIALPSASAEGATATGISDYGIAGWLPLGPFTGTFDGGNFSINNFYAYRVVEKVGLFGELGSGGTIKNLGVTGISGTTNSSTGRSSAWSSSGYQYAGLLVGYSAGTIDKCHATGNVASYNATTTSTTSYAGGLAGFSSGAITYSYATGNVYSSSSSSRSSTYAGGLVGYNTSSISNSYATGEVYSDSNAYAGGLVGYNTSSISNSYATGEVYSYFNAYAGGLVGYNTSSISNSYATGNVYSFSSFSAGGLVGYNTSSISNSYATGNVYSDSNSNAYAGGLVGRNRNGSYINCYRNSNATIRPAWAPYEASITGILAKPKAEMQEPAFVTLLNSGTSVWWRGVGKNDDLPYIRGVGVGR